MLSPCSPRRRPGPRRPILSDRRGAAIVEFALVAAPFIALLLAILQTGLAYLAQEALESAVETSARSIVTGQAQAADIQGSGAGMSIAQLTERFRQAGCKGLPSFMACNRLYVDVRSASSGAAFAPAAAPLNYDSRSGKPTNLSYDLGSQGSLVMVRFIYLWPMRLAPNIDLSGNGGTTTLIATSVSKSEAYQ
ncbi:TadE/TadG family type IV pilus assembly protein [uncultured Sphingomonas sp.]|uniref:TadE/TadG family type IV pilus assembly protein n=1 Tax=uncultured Sphingomonas sp. TaxID=158754 RepID=UPI0025CC1509|nr:TadE/TadG family type IV pilus assembly protein [uncultured Sphingomonas sp.]